MVLISSLANCGNECAGQLASADTHGQAETKSQPKESANHTSSEGFGLDRPLSGADKPDGLNKRQQIDKAEEAASNVAPQIAPSKKRYFILFMFVNLHMIKSFQWICLASVTNVVARFYRVDNLAINWTTILFMVTFLLLALPVSWIMERIGLRRAVLVGTLGVTCGVSIKCLSCYHEGFLYCMLGHLVVGLAEPFFFSSYSQVASVWFPDNQVAMATAWSVVGEQMGLALGFIIPPIMVGSDPEDDATIQQGLFRLFLAVAIMSAINTVSIVVFFDDKPKYAPGVARYKQIIQEEKRRRSSQALGEQLQRKIAAAAAASSTPTVGGSAPEDSRRKIQSDKASYERRSESPRAIALRAREVRQSVSQQIELSRDIVLNKHFVLLLVGFGINVGTVYSIHTLLNQMITHAGPALEQPNFSSSGTNRTNYMDLVLDVERLPSDAQRWTNDDANLVVGNTGLISILAGLLGSTLCGYMLDKHHRYKLTTAGLYLLTLASMLAFTGCLRLANSLALYMVAIPLGFAFTGYASCGFDYGVEITYPNPELLSSTMLNVSAQVCGIPISLIGSLIVDTYGSEALGLFFSSVLAVGLLITCLQGGQLRRQHAVQEGSLSSERPLASLSGC